MPNHEMEKHSITQSVVLHLLPGFLIGCFYFIARQPVQSLGYPSIFSLVLAVAFILVPVELGYLFYQGWQKTGRLTLAGVISYCNPIPWQQYIVWVLPIFIAIGAIFTLLKPIEGVLQETLFFWVPTLNNGLDGNYPKTTLIITYTMFFIFVTFLGPLVEELYFRGYLLPRIKGKFAILFHSLLFAAYHVFTPWMIITRTVALLPLIYGVQRKNIYIGIIVHILANSLDAITGFMFIAGMSS